MRHLRTLLASIKQLRGARPRDVQERADLHRLYLFSRLYEEHGGASGGGTVNAKFAERVVADAAHLSDDARKEAVARALRRQALGLARAVHAALEEDAGDPAPAAAALGEWSRRRRAGGQSGTAKQPMSRPGDDDDDDDDDDGGGSDSDGLEGDEARGGETQERARSPASPQALARLAARRVGFGLHVGPSAVGHQDAGLGLFVTAPDDDGGGSARQGPQQQQQRAPGHGRLGRSGAAPAVPVPAGALVALFPGLCYVRADFRRMAGYPKIDRSNPYLAARYDGRVVDSQPWARGDGAVAVVAGSSNGSSGGSSGSGTESSLGLDAFRPPRRPAPRNLLARMARASDAPRLPPAAAAALAEAAARRRERLVARGGGGGGGGGGWCSPTTDEATALELGLPLEARHPYALAHFANHPPPGQQPNAMIAPIDFAPGAFVGGGGGSDGAADEGEDEDGAPRALPAELRAYLPFAPYEAAAALTVWPVERALKARGEEAAVAAARRLADASRPWLWRRGAAELALRGAHGLGLVALRPLAEGDEIVFDYRLSPGMLGRPVWYEPVDEQAEDRRWA